MGFVFFWREGGVWLLGLGFWQAQINDSFLGGLRICGYIGIVEPKMEATI